MMALLCRNMARFLNTLNQCYSIMELDDIARCQKYLEVARLLLADIKAKCQSLQNDSILDKNERHRIDDILKEI